MIRNKGFSDNPLIYGLTLWVLLLSIFDFLAYKLFLFSRVKNVHELVSILPTVNHIANLLLVLSITFVILFLRSLILVVDRHTWQRSLIPLINIFVVIAVFIIGTLLAMVKFDTEDDVFQLVGKQAENYRVTTTVKSHDWKQVGKNTFIINGKTYRAFGSGNVVINHSNNKDEQSIKVTYQSYPELPKGYDRVKNVYNYGTDMPEYVWPRSQKNNKSVKVEITE